MSIRYNDDDNLYNNVEKNLIRPIQRIDGVADVSFRIRRKEIQIEVDKDRAEAYRLSISRLSSRLRINFTLSSGTVIDGGKKYLLKSTSTFHSLEDLPKTSRSVTPFTSRILPPSVTAWMTCIRILSVETKCNQPASRGQGERGQHRGGGQRSGRSN